MNMEMVAKEFSSIKPWDIIELGERKIKVYSETQILLFFDCMMRRERYGDVR